MSKEVTTTGKNMVRDLLESRKQEFGKALSNNINPDQFVRAALTMIQNSPKLMECTQSSLYSSLMQAASLSLSPDGMLGQAYLVPYGGRAQLIIGYKGLRELALRTNKYRDVLARVVYDRDKFKIEYGSNESLFHEPYEGDRGEMRGAYAMATTMDGAHLFCFMWKSEIEEHRDQYSKSWKKSDSMWQTATGRAWEKTLLRRLCGNRLQLSVVVQGQLYREDAIAAGIELPSEDMGDVIDIPSDDAPEPPEKPKGMEGLVDTVKKKTGPKPGKETDLRILVKDKIKKLNPGEDFVTLLDGYCTAILGVSTNMYEIETLTDLQLYAVWEEIKNSK